MPTTFFKRGYFSLDYCGHLSYLNPFVKDLTGLSLDKSVRSTKLSPRWEGVIGLYFLIGIF